MVDLFLQLQHLPEHKRRSLNEQKIIEEVVKKYPMIEVKNGDVLFGWVPKCSVDFREDEIHFSTNAALMDYMSYAAVAFADVLGIPVIDDPQMGREISVSEFVKDMDELQKNLARELQQSSAPRIIRLYPVQGDKFRMLQLENVIDETNKRIGKRVLVKIPIGNEFSFSVVGEDGTTLTKFTADEELRYLEAEYPKTSDLDHSEQIVAMLTDILPATKRTNR